MDLTVISNLSDVIAAVILYGGSLLLLLATLKGFHPFDAGVYGPTMGRRAGITDAGKLVVQNKGEVPRWVQAKHLVFVVT